MPTTINELLAKAGSQFSLAIFDAKSIAAIAATLIEKERLIASRATA
jgi:hypothetical protein